MASLPTAPTSIDPTIQAPVPSPVPPATAPVAPGPARTSDPDAISDFLRGRLSSAPTPTPAAPTPGGAPGTPTAPGGAPPVLTSEDLTDFDFDAAAATQPGLIPTPTPPTPATPTPTPTPETPTTPADDATLNLARTLAEGGLPKEVESAFLATQRGRRMLETFKVMRELEAPPAAGGIGFVPNAEQMREYYQTHSYWESLQDEFDNNPASFVHNFFSPDPQTGQFRPGVPAIAQSFLQSLEHYDPRGQLAQAAVAPVLGRPYVQIPVLQAQLNDLMALADTVPPGQNPDQFGVDEKSRILDAANILQSRIQARFSRNGGSPTALTTPSTRGGPDPLAQERAALAAERQRLNQTNQQIETNLVQNFRSDIMSTLESSIHRDIDSLLSRGGVKQRLETISPSQYNLYRDACVQEVYKGIAGSPVEGIAPSNPTALQSFNVALNRATRAVVQSRQPLVPGSEGDRARAHAIQQYSQIGRSVIRNLGAKFIKGAGGQIEAQTIPTQANLARMAAAAGQRESPGHSGPPVQHSLAPAVELPKAQPGQDPAEVISAYLANKLAGVR